MHTFETPNPVDLRVELRSGEILVNAEETTTTTIELEAVGGDAAAQEAIDNAKVDQRGDKIVVQLPKTRSGLFRGRGEVKATIRVPLHSNAEIETGSADTRTRGELGNLKFDSGSGDVEAEFGENVAIRTGSGDMTIGTAAGSFDSKSGSGDIRVDTIGTTAEVKAGSGDVMLGQVPQGLQVKTGSGDIVVKQLAGDVDLMAGSGDVQLKQVTSGRVRVKTGSGDIVAGIATGTAAYLDIQTVTGEVRSSLESTDAPTNGEATVELHLQSGTGDVVLQRT